MLTDTCRVTKMEDGGNLLLAVPAPQDQGILPLQANNFQAILAYSRARPSFISEL